MNTYDVIIVLADALNGASVIGLIDIGLLVKMSTCQPKSLRFLLAYTLANTEDGGL